MLMLFCISGQMQNVPGPFRTPQVAHNAPLMLMHQPPIRQLVQRHHRLHHERQAAPAWRYYLQEGMVYGNNGGGEENERRPLRNAAARSSDAFPGRPLRFASHVGPAVAADLDERIGWGWLGEQCLVAEVAPARTHLR